MVCECCLWVMVGTVEVGYRKGAKRSDWDKPRERNQMKERRLERDEQSQEVVDIIKRAR